MLFILNKNKKKMLWAQLLGLSVVVVVFLFFRPFGLRALETSPPTDTGSINSSTDGTSLDEINQQLDEKRSEIKELKKQAELYQKNIQAKQQEAVTLKNQLSLIDVQVQQTENTIEQTRQEIEAVNLEIDSLKLQIADKEVELENSKNILSEYLKLIYKYDQKTYVEIFVANTTFSEIFDQMKYTKDLQQDVSNALTALKEAKAALETEKVSQEEKQTELTQLSEQLQQNIVALDGQKEYKITLLDQTQSSEEKFNQLLEEAKREEQSAEAEMNALESQARSKLEDKGVQLNVSTALMWPVSPTRGISAYFHDPDYPFRYLFEHPAIDIPEPQGTPIQAADNGYVVRAKNAGMGYSYIMIVHNDEISTVYGHVSRIDVAEDQYVVRGQQIGLVGGTPGTPGAGGLTTGPHLHFEVRSGGIPVNPLDYLPAL